MTEPEQPPEDERTLDPRQEARLRHLLARARHDEPVPDDVAARLDRVLADLADAARQPGEDHPDQLASRRRRVVGLLLAAAAVVAVAGVGVHALRGDPVTDAATSGPADSSADSSASRVTGDTGGSSTRPSGEALTSSAPDSAQRATPGPSSGTTPAVPFGTLKTGGLPVLTDAGFSDQVRRLVRVAGPAAGSDAADADGTTNLAAERCRLPRGVSDGGARTLDVVYRAAPAALVVRPRQGQSQVVDLVRCGSGQVLRSVTLAR